MMAPNLLSDATCEQILALAERYPERRTALLPALKLAQAEIGYLPSDVIAEAADLVGAPHSAAWELVAFYTMLLTEPEGRTRVVVCGQLPCALRGADRLVRDLSASLAARISLFRGGAAPCAVSKLTLARDQRQSVSRWQWAPPK
jgi:NADH-quinone oxidoreductase subunit E